MITVYKLIFQGIIKQKVKNDLDPHFYIWAGKLFNALYNCNTFFHAALNMTGSDANNSHIVYGGAVKLPGTVSCYIRNGKHFPKHVDYDKIEEINESGCMKWKPEEYCRL